MAPKPLITLFTLLLAAPCALLSPLGCQGTYYKTMEMFGKEKRDLLVQRVKAARTDQEEAKEQFSDALERFSDLVNHDGGDLRKAYDKAKSEFEESEVRAEDVRDRIDDVESVGKDLFSEWEKELKEYSSEQLRQNSRRQLRETRARYDEMLAAMKRAEATMDPVLAAFRDQVLSLKHNLNAQAVAALRGSVTEVEAEIAELILEMEASIREADRFLKDMGSAA